MKYFYTFFLFLLCFSQSLLAQSSEMNDILNAIYSGLGNEDVWNVTLEQLDDHVDNLEEKSYPSDQERVELQISRVFYDFLGEISPYSGRNYDLKEDDFFLALGYLDKIGVDYTYGPYDSSFDFPVVKLELWEGNVTVLFVHNTSECLHRYGLVFSNGDEMTAGADAKTFRAYTTYGIDTPDPKVTSFASENVGYQPNCRQ